jgi:hypothetical protein
MGLTMISIDWWIIESCYLRVGYAQKYTLESEENDLIAEEMKQKDNSRLRANEIRLGL